MQPTMQFDDNFLQSVGLGGMPADQKQAFLQHLYDELELRVGTRLSEGMSNEQLEEFEKLIDANNQQGALTWLETNRPNYKQVVAEELEKLKQEVVANKDLILGDMQVAQNQPQGSMGPERAPGMMSGPAQQPSTQPPAGDFGYGQTQGFGQQPNQPQDPAASDPTQLNIR
jgi:hypothetical protein